MRQGCNATSEGGSDTYEVYLIVRGGHRACLKIILRRDLITRRFPFEEKVQIFKETNLTEEFLFLTTVLQLHKNNNCQFYSPFCLCFPTNQIT